MIITIDGPAGAGKSSVAKAIADKLHFFFLDTGALYRAIAAHIMLQAIDPTDEQAVTALVTQHPLIVHDQQNPPIYSIDQVDLSAYLRLPAVSTIASIISSYAVVRHSILPLQRSCAHQRNIVCEGRDMGSVVFPDADLKIFLTATLEARASRRSAECHTNVQQTATEINERDLRDQSRSIAPLMCPTGAITIDTSSMSLQDVIDHIVTMIYNRGLV